MKWNKWTEAWNFLLVEKLVSKSEKEVWKEMAISVDSSSTFETEACKCKAIRKYACYYQIPVESVKIEDVTKSPHGIQGWCEMNVTVPGINDKVDSSQPAAKVKAKAKAKGKAAKPGADEPDAHGDGAQDQEEGKTGQRGQKKGNKVKKEITPVKAAEDRSKDIMAQLQKSQQIMDKVSGSGDQLPSEWKWAKPFLTEWIQLLKTFQDALFPSDGEDLRDFADELKIALIDKTGMRSFKKKYGDQYGNMMILFADRCGSIGAQKLWSN